MKHSLSVTCALALGASFPAHAADRSAAFRYQAGEYLGGLPQTAYTVDFLLSPGAGGVLDAVILSAAKSNGGGAWTMANPSIACRQALHAPPGALAKVRLWPTTPGDDPLGPSFLDSCAPDEVFFPLTDILNIAVILRAPQYQVRALRTPGQSLRWPGFVARFNRNGMRFEETAPGGDMALISRSRGETVVEWRPDPARLMIEQGGPPPTRIEGVEHWAFRLGLDPREGALHWAHAVYDDIDMTVQVPGLPAAQQPKVKLTRRVSIAPVPAVSSSAPGRREP